MLHDRQAKALFLIAALVSASALAAAAGPGNSNQQNVIIGFEDVKDPSVVQRNGGTVKYSFEIIDAVSASVPRDRVANLRRNPRVSYVEKDVEVHALGEQLPWGVDRVDAEHVWGDGEDSRTVTGNAGSGAQVAVVDTGIDYTHPELDGVYLDGYDYVNGDDDPKDDNGHGTHVSGTVAAEENTEGLIGVAPETGLYSLKVLDSDGSGTLSDVVKGIEWAVQGPNGVEGDSDDSEVVSLSLGTSSDSSSLQNAVQNAYKKGTLPVAAAGNDGDGDCSTTETSYPAAYPSTVAVGATNQDDGIADFSNSGDYLDIAAPGVDINSTMPTYDTYLTGSDGPPWRRYNMWYDTLSGTSMATPHVSGTAALVFAEGVQDSDGDGNLADDIEKKLLENTEDINRPENCQGHGLLDAEASVAAVDSGTAPNVTLTNPAEGETVNGTITMSADASDDKSVEQVVFYVDGDAVGSDLNGSDGWTTSWDSTTVSDGSHTATAEATDSDGLSSTDSNGFKTENNDNAPTASWQNPKDGDTVSGNVSIEIDADDDRGVSSVEWRVEGQDYSTITDDDNDGVYSDLWDSTSVSDGTYTLDARVNDTGGNTATRNITVTVDNNQAPNVAWNNPADGETVSGNVSIEVNASDTDGSITDAEWKYEGGSWLSLTDSNGDGVFTDTWTTTDVSDGTYSLDARATDDDGETSSSTITVTVDNVDDSHSPAIDSYTVTEAGSPNPHAEITADWNVSDQDGDLSQAKVEVFDSGGNLVDSSTTSISGSSASGTDQFKIQHADGESFDVKLTVTDSSSNEATATRTVTE